jgi:hypothetical protein
MAESTTSATYHSDISRAAHGANGPSRTNGGLVDRMRESATSQLTAQKDRATDGLGSVARAVRSSTQQLREQDHETVAGYVEQIANQIERFSEGIRQKNVTELLDDAQRLARRQPAVFIASAFAVGLVAARFLKSSASDEPIGSQWRGSDLRGDSSAIRSRSGPSESDATMSASTTPGSAFASGTADRGPAERQYSGSTGESAAREAGGAAASATARAVRSSSESPTRPASQARQNDETARR